MSEAMRTAHTLRLIVSNVPVAEAQRLARALVSEQLAACVNILPSIQSVYTWEGEVVEDEESSLIIKTTSAAAARCAARLVELHPYTTPEVLELSPLAVHELYAAWAQGVVLPGSDS